MSAPYELSAEDRERIFREDVLPIYRLSERTSLENPKAIILAGQPGAGKGTLSNAAKAELQGDVVTIDPDALRDHDPRAATFRHQHPYTWAGDTHTFASDASNKLLRETSSARKNLIFDITLSDGKWASESLIPDLKAKGYDVEIRAVATSRLESELGVERRFSQRLDAEGFGRYVPEFARDASYAKLPTSLDMVRANTDVPIRIFNREGVELYDSRTDARLPSDALETARDARLRDPAITQTLRDEWAEQQRWHRDLPDTLPNNHKVDPQTRENLLTQRHDLHIEDNVQRLAHQATEADRLARARSAHAMDAGTAPPGIEQSQAHREQDAFATSRASTSDPQPESIAGPSTAAHPSDPRAPDHPDHRLYMQIEHGVAAASREQGHRFDAISERLAMSAYHDAKAAGLTSADHVAIIQPPGQPQDDTRIADGTRLFVVQGQDASDPAARRATTDVAQAADRTLEQSLQRVEVLGQQQALAQQPNQPTPDEASRAPRMS